MVSTTTTGSAILTPDQVASLVVLPLIQTSVAMQASTVVQTGSHQLRVPRVTQDPSASFVLEGAEIPATDAAVDEINIVPAKLAALSIITAEIGRRLQPERVASSRRRDRARCLAQAGCRVFRGQHDQRPRRTAVCRRNGCGCR
jgi:Phage capsid family